MKPTFPGRFLILLFSRRGRHHEKEVSRSDILGHSDGYGIYRWTHWHLRFCCPADNGICSDCWDHSRQVTDLVFWSTAHTNLQPQYTYSPISPSTIVQGLIWSTVVSPSPAELKQCIASEFELVEIYYSLYSSAISSSSKERLHSAKSKNDSNNACKPVA